MGWLLILECTIPPGCERCGSFNINENIVKNLLQAKINQHSVATDALFYLQFESEFLKRNFSRFSF